MRSRSLALTIALAGVVSATSIAGLSARAEAQEGSCDLDPVTLTCRVEAPVPGQTGPGGSTEDTNTGGGRPRSGPQLPNPAYLNSATQRCVWVAATGADLEAARAANPDAPADAVHRVCVGVGPDGVATEGFDWVIPGQAAPPPDPAEVAAGMLAEAQAQMRAPQVVADPPVGTPSIITLPVFVQVTNWVDGFQVGPNCVQGVCVTLTAEPTLTFDPGEPGSEPIVCDPPGTRFDPNGPDPAVQAAAPGACAYAYQARTGADDRPEEWRGVVTVTWNVAWTAGEAGDEFPPYPLSTVIPREVDEVQTVVRD
jgi:hypothetical protein